MIQFIRPPWTRVAFLALVLASRDCRPFVLREMRTIFPSKRVLHARILNDDKAAEDRRRQSLEVGKDPILSLNMNLDALARAGAGERAQELYQRISALHQEGYYAAHPDLVSFNSVLKAWQSDPAKALEFWEEEEAKLSGKDQPDIRSYNTFLLALARAGMHESSDELLEQLNSPLSGVTPDRITYNTVLLSYLRSRNGTASAEKAEERIRAMLADDLEVRRPDIISFNTVMATWANHPSAELAAKKAEDWFQFIQSYPGVKPDVCTFTTLLQTYARLGRTERSQRRSANSASKRIKELFAQMKRNGLQPNRITYTVAMQEISRTYGAEAAHNILNEMLTKAATDPSVRPDVSTYSALINAYSEEARDDPETSVLSCLNLLDQMKSLAVNWPDVAPNEQTYTSVLSALTRSQTLEAGPTAEKFLEELWETPELEPSVIHYNACINAYAKGPRHDKAVRASRLWKEMRDRGVTADEVTYNCLLSAASSSFGPKPFKEGALRLANECFMSFLKDSSTSGPTSLSYYYWFKAVKRFVDPKDSSRDAIAEKTFRVCCQKGCLNDRVLRFCLKHFSFGENLLMAHSELDRIKSASISVRELPNEWSVNALARRK